jgi:hypothetical protein
MFLLMEKLWPYPKGPLLGSLSLTNSNAIINSLWNLWFVIGDIFFLIEVCGLPAFYEVVREIKEMTDATYAAEFKKWEIKYADLLVQPSWLKKTIGAVITKVSGGFLPKGVLYFFFVRSLSLPVDFFRKSEIILLHVVMIMILTLIINRV